MVKRGPYLSAMAANVLWGVGEPPRSMRWPSMGHAREAIGGSRRLLRPALEGRKRNREKAKSNVREKSASTVVFRVFARNKSILVS